MVPWVAYDPQLPQKRKPHVGLELVAGVGRVLPDGNGSCWGEAHKVLPSVVRHTGQPQPVPRAVFCGRHLL